MQGRRAASLVVSLRPYYLLREFPHHRSNCVNPPSADAAAACELLHSEVSKLQTSQSLILISGDFNHASLSSILPNFTLYLDCPTRDNKTLDLLYANKDANSSSPSPHWAAQTTTW